MESPNWNRKLALPNFTQTADFRFLSHTFDLIKIEFENPNSFFFLSHMAWVYLDLSLSGYQNYKCTCTVHAFDVVEL